VRYDDAVRTPGTRTCGSQARGGLCVTRDVISFRFAADDIFFFDFAPESPRASVRLFGTRALFVSALLFFFLELGP
jgi:hypothetical protein